MTTDTQIPGHSLNKGYPYNGIESQRMLPNRAEFTMREDKKIEVVLDRDKFPATNDEDRYDLKSFLFDRAFDYQEALKIAEGQLTDILEEKPFIPENYGFEVAHKHESPTSGPPVRMYVSKYDDRFSLFRKPMALDSKEWNPALWTLLKKNDEGEFIDTEVLIPCDRFAYVIFTALGVIIKEEEIVEEPDTKEESDNKEISHAMRRSNAAEDEEDIYDAVARMRAEEEDEKLQFSKLYSEEEYIKKKALEVLKRTYTHIVHFERSTDNGFGTIMRTIGVNAISDSDATSKAKFHLETNAEDPIEDIKFKELTIL